MNLRAEAKVLVIAPGHGDKSSGPPDSGPLQHGGIEGVAGHDQHAFLPQFPDRSIILIRFNYDNARAPFLFRFGDERPPLARSADDQVSIHHGELEGGSQVA